MKSKLIKILILIFAITTIILFIDSPVLTAGYVIDDDQGSTIDDVGQNPDYYKPTITTGDNTIFKEKIGIVLGVINAIGVVSSVIIITIIGMRYMLGSVEEKAEYKKTMLSYLIGAFLLFSSTTIPNIIYNFVS